MSTNLNLINFFGCLAAFSIGLILTQIEFLGEREGKILTILGWLIALYCTKVGGSIHD